jgi:glycosyltransferase EpsE
MLADSTASSSSERTAPAELAPSDSKLISVVMSSYRDDPAVLDRAIDSILQQDYSNFELILVFEPADPNVARVRGKFLDPRVIVIEGTERLGRCGAYNVGIRRSRGRFIARMDSDDECLSHRFSTEIEYFRKHPDVSVVGSFVRLLDREGREVGLRTFPVTHEDFVKGMAIINPICHPTVIWDVDKVGRDMMFDPEFNPACDDMELWLRMVGRGHRFANIPECLLKYTQPPNYQRSRENWRYMLAARAKHWRLCLRHPSLLLGLVVAAFFSVSPQGLINLATGRSSFSDRLRRIRK